MERRLYYTSPHDRHRIATRHSSSVTKTHINSRLDCCSNQKKLKIVYYFYTFCPR